MIVNDDKAQATVTYSQTQITDDVGGDSLWRKRTTKELSETYKIEASHVFLDQWQAGLSIPVVKRERSNSSSTGLGDISATLGYEYLPDWDYNPWRPKGVGFIQITTPTGRSIAESDGLFHLDARGRGFWALGLGTILTKIVGKWDLVANFDAHRSFDKTYSNSQSHGTLKPGYGASLGIGGGYNFSSFRLGSNITWTYEDPVDVSGTLSSRGAAQRYSTFTLSGSYLINQEWAATISYLDQTILGSPVNTSLGRGAMLVLQRRWAR